MRKSLIAFLICGLLAFPVIAHDLFLKPDVFRAKTNQKIVLSVMNGTFVESEGAVSFARLTDVSVVSPSGVKTHPIERDLTKNETTALLNLQPKEAGNYVVGLSTMWRENSLPAAEFNKIPAGRGHPGYPGEPDA
jgi:methionine-rich copper-binding protein CopC